MSDNKRIFYACQAVALVNEGDNDIVATDMLHGVQSVGINTNFNLEQVFELGQIEIYENVENLPDIEVTMEKVIDGFPLMYHQATSGVFVTGNSGLIGRSDTKCDLRLGIFDAQKNNVASSTANAGNAEVEVYCSGMFVSSISYTVPTEGNCTESITLIGNNKQWLSATGANGPKIVDAAANVFNGADQPSVIAFSGGVQRREDVLISGCIFPTVIQGVVGSGYGNGYNFSAKAPRIHVQNFTCSVDFNRDDVFELGRKAAYFRPASFPVEVTSEIEAITSSGDFINALEVGTTSLDATNSGNNLTNEIIYILLRCGVAFDLGRNNKLTSVTYGGGDAGGGNVSCTYSFQNFNELDVQDIRNAGYVGFGLLTCGAGQAAGSKFAKNIGAGPFPSLLLNGFGS